MKHSKLQLCVISTLLSFCLGFATIGCMVTGQDLTADLWVLAFGCLLISAAVNILLSARRGGRVLLIAGALALLAAVFLAPYRERLFALLRDILSLYQYSYGVTIPEFLRSVPYTSHNLALLTIHSIIALSCSWTVLRRCTVSFAILPALLFFATCFVVIDTVPSLAFILLWFFALILLLLTHPVRLRDPQRGLTLTKFLALPVAVALLGLALLIPPDTKDVPSVPAESFESLWNWAISKLPYIGTTSDGEIVVTFTEEQSEQVQLDTLGPRTPFNIPIMEITTDFSGTVYLRRQDFDGYSGLNWDSNPNRQEKDFTLPRLWFDLDGYVSIRTFGRRNFYYLPCFPDTAAAFTGGVAPNQNYDQEYGSFQCSLSDSWVQQWRKGQGLPSQSVDERYLALPELTLTQAKAILSQIPGLGQLDALDDAQRIAEYVRSIGRYDLNTPVMPADQEDFAIWFLQQGETGYCVHYATAATVLLRSAGIPARYVEGYKVAANASQVTIVRERQAHAWVEYYLDGVGWLMLDPTPGTDAQDITSSTTTMPSTTTQPPGPTSSSTTQTTIPTTPSVSNVPSSSLPSGNAPGGSRPGAPDWIKTLLWILVAFGADILAIEAQRWLRRKWKQRKLHVGSSNARALAHYAQIRHLSRLSKLPIPEELTELAEKACFSQHRLTVQELSCFDAFSKTCVEALGETHWLYRLYCRYIHAAY